MLDAMKGIGLDTLKATRTLEAAGFGTAQAEAMVTVFGSPIAGNAATKDDVRDLRLEVKDTRSELKAEIADCRSDLKADFAQLRDETKSESAELKREVARLGREVAEARGDVKSLKAQMYRLLLVQATVIVGLVVGLERLL